MKYFGCLEHLKFDKSNEKEIMDFLLRENIFELIQTASGNSSNIKDGVLELRVNQDVVYLEPCKYLVDEFYSFIMNNVFKNYILEQKMEFFNLLNNQIYGLEFLEQKKIALHHFNKIYQENYIDTIQPFNQTVSKNGITHTYSYGKIQMLYYQLNAFKNNLINKITVNNYLNGNRDFFTKENLVERYDINDELQFEIWVQILIELNDRFNFEEDLYFTTIKTDKLNFKKYRTIFKTLLSYQFTNNKIRTFKKDPKAHIESLYEVLVKEELITDHKENFVDFVKDEYGKTISKIISYKKDENYSHDDRVKQFSQEWEDLTSKKD